MSVSPEVICAMIGYCGTDCLVCSAFTTELTRPDDQLLVFPGPRCCGCTVMYTRYRDWEFTLKCEVASCASARGVETCAHCEDYICDTLQRFFEKHGGNQAKDRLEKIRSSLEE